MMRKPPSNIFFKDEKWLEATCKYFASSTEEEAEMMKVLSLFIHSAYCQQGFATFSQLDFAINMDFINF